MATNKSVIASAIGTILSATGVALQPSETLQIISLIVTIIGTIFSFIIVPIISWYIKVKKDGKITAEELKEGATIVGDGVGKIVEDVNKADGKESTKH